MSHADVPLHVHTDLPIHCLQSEQADRFPRYQTLSAVQQSSPRNRILHWHLHRYVQIPYGRKILPLPAAGQFGSDEPVHLQTHNDSFLLLQFLHI